MNNLSTKQLLGIWEELYDCMLDRNGYGGTVAEIYMFRLMPYNPLLRLEDRTSEVAKEAYAAANRSLYEVCKLFEEHHEVTVRFEGNHSLEILIDTPDDPFHHRVHIEVKKK